MKSSRLAEFLWMRAIAGQEYAAERGDSLMLVSLGESAIAEKCAVFDRIFLRAAGVLRILDLFLARA